MDVAAVIATISGAVAGQKYRGGSASYNFFGRQLQISDKEDY